LIGRPAAKLLYAAHIFLFISNQLLHQISKIDHVLSVPGFTIYQVEQQELSRLSISVLSYIIYVLV